MYIRGRAASKPNHNKTHAANDLCQIQGKDLIMIQFTISWK